MVATSVGLWIDASGMVKCRFISFLQLFVIHYCIYKNIMYKTPKSLACIDYSWYYPKTLPKLPFPTFDPKMMQLRIGA